MVVLVSVETVLLVLLVMLVAGLLRSHAEILRRQAEARAVLEGDFQHFFRRFEAELSRPGLAHGGDVLSFAFSASSSGRASSTSMIGMPSRTG